MPPSRGRGHGHIGPLTEQVRRHKDTPPAPEVRIDPRLVLESEPFAKWVGDWWWFRIIALLIVWRGRRTRGDWVAPFPWRMVLLGWAIVVTMALAIILVALVFAQLRANPYET
jgi:hypothetical protein